MDAKHDYKTLRQTFNRAADLYQKARPDYPDELYEQLIRAAELKPGARLLEVGCATGKATLPLARRGFSITCIELGAALAAAARRNLAGLNVEVMEGRFEEWKQEAETGAERGFDLVYAATAWSWIDPQLRYRKAWEALRPGGYLAFWNATHVFPDGGDPFFGEIQTVYEEIGEGKPEDILCPRPGELSEQKEEIEGSGLFEVVHVEHFDWERIYKTEEYIDLLRTFSGHILMEDWQRDKLFNEIRLRLNARPDQSVRRHWGAVLHIARRIG
ncbi:class I SAM-dependent methyltransferase [Paenibacillus silvisoli]|uniref:class I SAM-dependent methyltransferase n=1 Tax=Paenibacillus silvisoli TaxID=3110539 RepID=UPI0028043CA1|nr:class I SAM-dependent methyltransferase [Paenibacillus silvisoli]